MTSVWWCLIIVCASYSSIGNGQRCMEGQQTRRNNMYYVCRNGAEVPVACSSVDGIRVEPGANHRTTTFLFTCQQLHSQAFVLMPTACIKNGQVVNIGGTVVDQHFWYTCTREGDQVQLKVSGCVGERGEQVGPNGIISKQQQFLFRCVFTGGTVAIQPYGCIVDGSHHPAGQDILSRDFWYQCTILPSGGGLELKLGGCVNHGQKLYNGSTVVRGQFIHRCDIIGHQARFGTVGCVDDHGAHHMIGETWRMGTGTMAYVMECKKEMDRISIQARQCYYQGFDGSGPLDPQCVRRFGRTMVKCNRSGDRVWGELTTNASDEQYRNALNSGFRAC